MRKSKIKTIQKAFGSLTKSLACASIVASSFFGCSTLNNNLKVENSERSDNASWSVNYLSYFPKLEDSERKIDKIEKVESKLFPSWDKLETFSDWRDDGRLGNLCLAYNKPINDKLNWYTNLYLGYGEIENSQNYRFLRQDIDFMRFAVSPGVGLDYYPMGRTNSEKVHGNSLLERAKWSVRNAKPRFSAGAGYGYQETSAILSATGPLGLINLRYEEKDHERLVFLYPQFSVDFPLNDSSTFSLGAGKLFVWKSNAIGKDLEEVTGPFVSFGLVKKFNVGRD